MKEMPRIIVALDGMGYEESLSLAKALKEKNAICKVNDGLDSINGLQILSDLHAYGETMDDPKFHDIPKTMRNRVSKHAAFVPKFITVHASNTLEALIAAKRGVLDSESKTMLLGVTVLTSYTTEECEIDFGASTKAKVLQFARKVLTAKLDGIVCSGLELEFLSKFKKLDPLIRVVPAIRSAKSIVKNDDQKRIIYIPDAVKLGADYFVIGRPITEAPDPAKAFDELQAEIENSWNEFQK